MPPKKGKAKAGGASVAAPAPATAASGRPRRSTSAAQHSAVQKPASKTTQSHPKDPDTGRSAGGRLPQVKTTRTDNKKPAGRSRAKKDKANDDDESDGEQNAEDDDGDDQEIADSAPAPPKRARVRKDTSSKPAPAASSDSQAPPRKRGRPPQGGETTKVSTDEQAAAEQLETELVDSTEDHVAEASSKKRKLPAPKAGKTGKAEAKKSSEAADDGGDGEAASSGPQYWLMKAEQEDRMETLKSGREFNTKFTIDDLRLKDEPEPWDGVRNAVAAKHMRAMKVGDQAFFYASGGKAGRKPGITGIMEIVKEHEPDETAWDEDAYGFVEKESDRNRWCVVHVEFRKKLSAPVSLKELQEHAGSNGALANMQVLNTARLSVTKVSEQEWRFIVDNLIEGYEIWAEGGNASNIQNDVHVRVEIPPASADKKPLLQEKKI